jgi:outer membrane protein TolC
LQTELALVNNRLLDARQAAAVAAARLAEAISYNSYDPIVPMDVVLVPLDLMPADVERGELIGTGLAMRPELKESQALVAAACEAYRRETWQPSYQACCWDSAPEALAAVWAANWMTSRLATISTP